MLFIDNLVVANFFGAHYTLTIASFVLSLPIFWSTSLIYYFMILNDNDNREVITVYVALNRLLQVISTKLLLEAI